MALIQDFVDEVEKYCLRPGARRDRHAYSSYVIQTCYELRRGGTTLEDTTIEMLRATLFVVAGSGRLNILTAKPFGAVWQAFVDRCIHELVQRAAKWPTEITVAGQRVTLSDWVEDKTYTTIRLRRRKPRRGKK